MRHVGACLLALGLAACDEATIITHVDRLSHMTLSDLLTMQGPNGIPVEFHGQPFSTVARADLATALRPPAGTSQSIRFSAVQPGHGGDHGWRLVLHVNPTGPPNGPADCRRTSEAETDPPQTKGYRVNATFCKGDAWQAHGYLRAPEVEDGDIEAFRNNLQQLMSVIFAENSDPDR